MYTYLALGDSYTIGEQVPVYESFPYQTLELLRRANVEIHAPEIVAKTGFTTDELLQLIGSKKFLSKYDFVSLLIGVNNQYRGRDVDNFKDEFSILLNKAIAFAGTADRVVVLSIPDWGVTPFAAERDIAVIAQQIDAFNEVCKVASVNRGCHFIDITTEQRINGNKPEYLAGDQLHPSGKEYAHWAEKLSARIQSMI